MRIGRLGWVTPFRGEPFLGLSVTVQVVCVAGLPPVTTFEMHKNGLDCVQIFVRDVEAYESDVWVSRVPELRL